MAETLPFRPSRVNQDGFARISLTGTAIRADPLAVVRKFLAGIAIGLGSASLVLLIAWPGWLDMAELKTYDWRMRTWREIGLHARRSSTPTSSSSRSMTRRFAICKRSRPMAVAACAVGGAHRLPASRRAEGDRRRHRLSGRRSGRAAIRSTARTTRAAGRTASSPRRSNELVTSSLLADAVDPGLVGGEVQQEGLARTSLSARPGDRRAPGHHAAVRHACTRPRRDSDTTFSRSTVTVQRAGSLPFVRKGDSLHAFARHGRRARRGRLSSGRCRPRRRRDSDRRSSHPPRSLAGHRRRQTLRSGTTSRRCSSTIVRLR